jgi:hypothetical protein
MLSCVRFIDGKFELLQCEQTTTWLSPVQVRRIYECMLSSQSSEDAGSKITLDKEVAPSSISLVALAT